MMGKRAPNMILGELRREAGKYREATQSAQDNNVALHRAITTHLPNLQLLCKPLDQVMAAIPSVANVEGELGSWSCGSARNEDHSELCVCVFVCWKLKFVYFVLL